MKHKFEDIGGNSDGTFWWCSICGTICHDDNEEGPKYVPSNGECDGKEPVKSTVPEDYMTDGPWEVANGRV